MTENVEISNDTSNKQGYCILRINEIIDIKNTKYIIQAFGKRKLMLKRVDNDILKVGEQHDVKGATFIVESKGTEITILRVLAGNKIIDDETIQNFRKQQVENLRKG